MKKSPPNKKQLLDDLDKLRGLLGEEAEDDVSLDDLPLLSDEHPAEDGDADDQLPLLQPANQKKPTDTATTGEATNDQSTPKQSKKNDPKDKLAGRENPFLKKAEDSYRAKQTAKSSTNEPRPTGERAAPPLSEKQVNHLIDQVIDECLPHIEQTLRVHLTAALHRHNRDL